MAQEPMLNIGRDKTPTPVSRISMQDLEWYANECTSDRHAAIAAAEIARRENGDTQSPGSAPRNDAPPRESSRRQSAPQGRRSAPRQQRASIPADLIGGLRDPGAITERLRHLAEHFNLISPATACATIPVGCEVCFSFVVVDPTVNNKGDGPDVYEQKGGGCYSLKGTVLTKIARAAGVTWDLPNCNRIDDRRNPHFAEHLATGRWQEFDGSWTQLSRSKTIDLRDGSAQIADMSDKQLTGKRRTINEIVEAGSLYRVIRQLGVKHTYTAAELERPFAVARLVFTGVTDDPELKAPMAMLKAQQMLGANAALFGRAAPAPALGPAAPAPAQLPGRVVESAGVDQDDEPDYGDTGTDDERY